MGSRNKLKKFSEFKQFWNTLDHPKDTSGVWGEAYFQNKNPIILELGCGKGEYTIELAKRFPNHNLIGIDIQSERMWTGAKQALYQDLPNVRFLRIYIDHITDYFTKEEVDEIWLTFPDPHPRKKTTKKRLTSPRFLDRYKKILKPNAILHLKTDNKNLFDYSLKTIQDQKGEIIEKIENVTLPKETKQNIFSIQTTFEKKYRTDGKNIYYLCWRFLKDIGKL